LDYSFNNISYNFNINGDFTMVKIKKNYKIKTCLVCKKKKAMHKNRVTCSTVCAKKYTKIKYSLYKVKKKWIA